MRGNTLRARLFVLQTSTAFFFLYLLIRHFTSHSKGLSLIIREEKVYFIEPDKMRYCKKCIMHSFLCKGPSGNQ
ncbi:hypothetical protein KSU1_C0071 [Candidatus Jettenia caeni]|uniref:Uncharacterized protein n=1 Tax=Candidatus Jettenia caeni TaxID=247490 RepID=I3IIX2_9BACT|nr:hypothetical protein KSU1_C0071 [Candidatus Jettenia caeni]